MKSAFTFSSQFTFDEKLMGSTAGSIHAFTKRM